MKNVDRRKKLCWPLFILLAAISMSFPAKTFGQSSNRWLLIFETTSAMRHRTNGVLTETQDLLQSGMHGLVHTGDTIGIWTFNDRLHTGEAPLQTWSPQASGGIIRHTLQFLNERQYAKSARMEDMLTNMLNLVDASPFITVILFTDGDDLIKGTPFDAQINEVYKSGYHQQKKASMPIVTVLRGVAGDITANTVTLAPWPADIPPVPPPPPAPPPKPRAAPAPKPPPAPTAPPLIYNGKKPETAPSSPQSENNAPPVAPSNTTESNSVLQKAEILAPPSASVPSESPVGSAATPTVTPAATRPTAVAEAPPAAQTSGAQRSDAVAANQSSKPVAPSAISPSIAANEPGATPKVSNPQSAPRANVATVASAPAQVLFSARNIAIGSVAFAAIVCGLLLMSARHARASQASLITRSLDRERR